MKYAFFIDIDGTLMFEGRLPKENIDAIAKARKNGHYVFINTGRSLAVIQPVVKESIQFDGLVTALGSYITVGNKVIHECPVSDEILKETGMNKVMNYLGKDNVKTVAIGDSLNDVPMFEAADYSAVMGDGVESIKEMADYVSRDAARGGVGDAIEYFISREADI